MTTAPRRQQGFLLLMAAVLIVIVGFLGVALTYLITADVRSSGDDAEAVRALFLAESGLERGLLSWSQNPGTYVGETNTPFGTGSFTVTVDTDGSNFVALGYTNPLPGNQRHIRSVGLMASGVTRTVDAIVEQGAASGFAVGKNGTVQSWDGSVWNTVTPFTGEELNAAYCVSASDCWVAGKDGEIWYWDGAVWAQTPSGTGEDLEGIACQTGGGAQCFAVGKDGVIQRWNGGPNWSNVFNAPEDLLAVHCPSNDCYAVGKDGYVARYTGGSWGNDAPLGTGEDLNGVACTSGVNCWAVAKAPNSNNFRFNRRTGGGWSEVFYPASKKKLDLLDVTCVSANDCWAVGKKDGNNFTFTHWNGATWAQPAGTLGGGDELRGVSCIDSNNCWAAGKKGVLTYWNGSSWTTQVSGTGQDLNAIAMPPGGAGTSIVAWREVFP